jgi:hypothetical protein
LISFFGGDEAYVHSEEIGELGADPLDTEACLPHTIRTALGARARLLPVSATGAGQRSVPSVQDERQVAVGAALDLSATIARDGGRKAEPL